MFQVILFAMDVLAVVMSGEVGDWFACGRRVGVSVFRIICDEFCRRSAINTPLWSSLFECQRVECALMSPAMILLVRVSRYWKVFAMSVSSVAWFGSVVCLGGM